MLINVFKEVFRNRGYVFLTTIVALIFILFAILLPNIPLLFQLLQGINAPLLKAEILFNLLAGIQTNFTPANRIFTFIIAIFFGIYISLFVFFWKRRKKMIAQTRTKTGFIGLVNGMLGVGCASCGSFLLSTIFSTAGAVGIITLLPLKGVEFAILSVVLLSFSIYTLSKNIVNAGLCKVP